MMTRRFRDHLDRLRRRAEHLQHRISNYRESGNPSYDKAELSATLWAISIIEAAEREGILNDLDSVRQVGEVRA